MKRRASACRAGTLRFLSEENEADRRRQMQMKEGLQKRRQQRIFAVMSTRKPNVSKRDFAIAGFSFFRAKSRKPLRDKGLRHVGKSVENVDN